MNRGFTLVELAIVIVIAGILAAVAIPIYQGAIERAKWAEGKSNAGAIMAPLKVSVAEQSGAFPAAAVIGASAINYSFLALTPADYDSSNFLNSAFTCTNVVPGPPATWQISVASGTTAGGPQVGIYVLNNDGTVDATSTAP
ncbi:MAG: type IV pilin protein [Planctomycetota bacterium]